MTPLGNFTDQRIFEPTLLGRLKNGRFVRVKAIGNQEGKSPAYLCWNEDGQSTIESITEVTMVDPNNIPPTVEQAQRLYGEMNRSETASSRR